LQTNLPHRYAAVYSVRPAVKLNFRCDLKVNLKDEAVQIIASDMVAQSDNKMAYAVGVRLEVRVDAESQDDAFEKANIWAAAFASTLSLVSNVGIAGMQSEFACDISESEEKRPFLQLFHGLPIPSPSTGKVDERALIDVYGKLVEEKMPYSDRIGRAIAFYTKGLHEIHPLERFTSFWLGLETLNEPLRSALSASDVVVSCECGRKRKVSALTGVRELFRKELPDGEAAFKKARDIRVALMHSTKPLSPLLPEVGRQSDISQEILRKAIFRFLDVPYQGDIVRAPISNLVPIWLGLEGTINGVASTEKLTASGEYPHLVPSGMSVQTIVESDASVTINPIVDYKAVGLPDGANFLVVGSRIYGEKGKLTKAKTLAVTGPGNQQA
jgi:hypothetical protein